MADAPPAAAPADDAKRQRDHVDKLLARPAAESRGSVTVGGKRLDYKVHAAFMPVLPGGLASASGEPEAAILTTSYQLEGASAAERPVCFAFNGGPGSASVWLHLGALGPKRVVVPDDGSTPRPPYAVEDNPHSWLRHFDLVFIDPPHTGWSVCASDAARKKMLSVDGDVAALAEVMRGWLTRHQRWGSTVYLAGESYGTTRGAALADALLGMGVGVAGAVLVSCAMDLQSIVFAPANDLPFGLFLPGFANVAQYHGLLQGELGASPAAARAAAEAFVQEEYVAALHAGARLSDKGRARIARRVAELTACRGRWWRRRTFASPTCTSSSRRCATAGCRWAGSTRASRARWARAASASSSSTPASRPSRRRTRWRRWPTSGSSVSTSSTATRCSTAR